MHMDGKKSKVCIKKWFVWDYFQLRINPHLVLWLSSCDSRTVCAWVCVCVCDRVKNKLQRVSSS